MPNQQSHTSVQETKPLVSFIIPYYNLPVQMLQECIESILRLSLRPFEREIIVVDDGSDHSPVKDLPNYENNIIYIRQKNTGPGGARNQGIQMAKGLYLQFVDADDYLIRTPYEYCLDIMRNQQPDMIMFDFRNDIPQKHLDTYFNSSELKNGTDYMSLHNLRSTVWGYLFKYNILGNLRFNTDIYNHEDEEFTPQLLLRAETLCITNAKAYYYRQRSHSLTSESNKRQIVKRLNEHLLVIKNLSCMTDTLPLKERQAIKRRVAQLTMDYIYAIIMQTHNRHYLNRKLLILKKFGLFPLPNHHYTTKYKWFRRLTNCNTGLFLLINLLPLLQKER